MNESKNGIYYHLTLKLFCRKHLNYCYNVLEGVHSENQDWTVVGFDNFV